MLVIVLGLYLLTASLITSVHVGVEYRSQKAGIVADMQALESAYASALGLGLWSLDANSLTATMQGLLSSAPLEGVVIQTEAGTLVARGKSAKNGRLEIDLAGLQAAAQDDWLQTAYTPITHEFPIRYSLNGREMVVGKTI